MKVGGCHDWPLQTLICWKHVCDRICWDRLEKCKITKVKKCLWGHGHSRTPRCTGIDFMNDINRFEKSTGIHQSLLDTILEPQRSAGTPSSKHSEKCMFTCEFNLEINFNGDTKLVSADVCHPDLLSAFSLSTKVTLNLLSCHSQSWSANPRHLWPAPFALPFPSKNKHTNSHQPLLQSPEGNDHLVSFSISFKSFSSLASSKLSSGSSFTPSLTLKFLLSSVEEALHCQVGFAYMMRIIACLKCYTPFFFPLKKESGGLFLL